MRHLNSVSLENFGDDPIGIILLPAAFKMIPFANTTRCGVTDTLSQISSYTACWFMIVAYLQLRMASNKSAAANRCNIARRSQQSIVYKSLCERLVCCRQALRLKARPSVWGVSSSHETWKGSAAGLASYDSQAAAIGFAGLLGAVGTPGTVGILDRVW
jgi:hypothetical protein